MNSKKLVKKLIPFTVTAILCGSTYVFADDNLYAEGQKQLDKKNWSSAQETFTKIIKQKDGKVDAALYWLAYAQFKSKKNQQALNTINQLKKRFPDSRWLDDASALKIEINDKQGNSTEIDDDEMKLYAINALLSSSSEKSTDILTKILEGDSSTRIKKRALFVLSQSGKAESFKIVAELASGKGDPSLQLYAIETLGISGSEKATSILKNVYQTSTDEDIKTKVLRSFMVQNNSGALLEIVRQEKNKDLKSEAIRQIGVMDQPDILYSLYQDNNFSAHKEDIIQGLAVSNAADYLVKIIESEKEEELILHAVEKMGIVSASKIGSTLLDLYNKRNSHAIKEKVIKALFIQSNVKSLIHIIKLEKEPSLKREALKHLSLIDSDEVVEYFNQAIN